MAVQARWTLCRWAALAAICFGVCFGDSSISIAVGSTVVSKCAEDDVTASDLSAMLQVKHGSAREDAKYLQSPKSNNGEVESWNQVAGMVDEYYQEGGDALVAAFDTTMAVVSALDELQKGDSWQKTIIAVAQDLLPVVSLVCPTVGAVAGLFLSLFSSPNDLKDALEQLRMDILKEVAHMIDDRVAMDNYKGALAAVASMTDVINDHPKWVGNKTEGYKGDWDQDAGLTFSGWADMATQNLRFVFSTDCLNYPDGHSPSKSKSKSCLLFQRFGPLIFQAQFATLHLNLIAQWGAYIPTDQPVCKNNILVWSRRYGALLEDSLSGFLSVVQDSTDYMKEHLMPDCKYDYPRKWGDPKCGTWPLPKWHNYNCSVYMDAAHLVDPVTQLDIADEVGCTNKYAAWITRDYCRCKAGTNSLAPDQATCYGYGHRTCYGGDLCEFKKGIGYSVDSKDGRPLCTNEHYKDYRMSWLAAVEKQHWPLIVRMKACGSITARGLCNLTSLQHSGTRLFSSYPTQFHAKRASGVIAFDNASVIGISVVMAGDCQGHCAKDAGVVKGFGLLGASPDELRNIQAQSTSSTTVNLPAEGVFKSTGSFIAVCPDGLVVTGLTANWSGTCQSKCKKDGPVLSSMTLKCSVIPPQSGTLDVSTFLIQPKKNAATAAICPKGNVITSLWVDTAGDCGHACQRDAPMISGIGGTCGAIRRRCKNGAQQHQDFFTVE